ncbi:IS1381 transposase orf A [Streptococcus pneumoniae]|nr:IS1381 transposase orf A [Streptococcus pneumoniae]
MNDEASKQLTDARFKRLVGVQRKRLKCFQQPIEIIVNASDYE